MHRKTWKAFEQRVARFFGTRRNPLSGGNSGNTRSHSRHDSLSLESKHGKRNALWSLFLKTRPLAVKEGKIPVICTGSSNQEGFLVTVHSNDLPAFVENYLQSLKQGLTS